MLSNNNEMPDFLKDVPSDFPVLEKNNFEGAVVGMKREPNSAKKISLPQREALSNKKLQQRYKEHGTEEEEVKG